METSRTWYESDQLKYEGTYKNGDRDGTWKYWYESDQMESEGTYKNRDRDGTWRIYENGRTAV